VAQTGTDGYGPAYLLNGLGNTGYWYQVGLSYDWDGSASTGFQLAYEVFNSSGSSVYPATGGGMAAISPVNPGDTILTYSEFLQRQRGHAGLRPEHRGTDPENLLSGGSDELHRQFVGARQFPRFLHRIDDRMVSQQPLLRG